MGFLTGKRILITGLISARSIAYGIAEAMHREGAELAFTYQSDKVRDRVVEMAEAFGSKLVFQCDVASDEDIAQAFAALGQHWDYLDSLVHSVAYAPADQLQGNFSEVVNREGFRIAHDISAYSFAALAKAAAPMMANRQGSMVALTYIGSQRCLENYNVMGVAKASLEATMRYLASSLGPKGIRVNCVSAGPIKTLAASGVKDLRKMLQWYAKIAPMRENVTIEQVGNAAAFLCSDLASGVTGDILYVDSGFHMMGMPSLDDLGG